MKEWLALGGSRRKEWVSWGGLIRRWEHKGLILLRYV